MSSLLRTEKLEARYGDAQALFGIDFHLEEGEIVAIIGANGAGKSTFLKAITGVVGVPRGAVNYRGEAIGGLRPGQIVARGIAMVPEGRRLFPSLSVEENLRMGACSGRRGPWTLERVYALFPVLRERRRAGGTALSGGQQQMVAIGRALMSNPQVLLCDELSLGLAPLMVQEIYAALPGIVREGMTVVVVEQDVRRAQAMSRRVVCFQEGRVSLAGASDALTHEQIAHAYFGAPGGTR
jgi:branched-chain amino acid transport system ATP-binding protein